MPRKIRTCITLDSDVKDVLDTVSNAMGVPVSQIVNRVLRRWIAEERPLEKLDSLPIPRPE